MVENSAAETELETISIQIGNDEDDDTPLVMLVIGEKRVQLTCELALHIGLTLQQLAYASTVITQASQVLDRDGYSEAPEFREAMAKEMFKNDAN